MHRQLTRQLKRAFGDPPAAALADPRMQAFITMVDGAYAAADTDRELLERSMEIASGELYERNGELTSNNERLAQAEHELRASHEDLEKRVVERTVALRAAIDLAEAASRAKSAFLANMSHEIRTPMSAILGYAEMLLLPDVPRQKRLEFCMTIRRQGEYLLAILNDILDLSKIEAGKVDLEAIACDPRDVIGDAVALLRMRAIEKRLTCEVAYLADVPQTIHTDPTRLRQIVINLLGNAIKFTDKGSVRIEVRMEPPLFGGDAHLRLDFVDTGCGMTPAQIAGLFKPFAQVDSSSTRRYGGTGLGLTICKRLADMLGGSIRVESEPAQGSRFIVTINAGDLSQVPVLSQAAADTSKPRPVEPAVGDAPEDAPVPLLSGRVLLAEDGVFNQHIVRFYLEATGIEVVVVEDGRQAVNLALDAMESGAGFDLILMDMQMPELDGYGATGQLRQRGYAGPIVALTAHAMSGDREKCLAAGCTDYLTKPVGRQQLVALVASHLSPAPVAGPGQETVIRSAAVDPDLAGFLAAFVADLPVQVNRMLESLRAADAAVLQRTLHSLKGTAGMYGFGQITENAGKAESRLMQAGIASVAADVQALVHLIQRVEGFDKSKVMA